jgi:hypothetical protein
MDDTAKRLAEDATEKALSEAPFADFRSAYRDRLRWLKEARSPAFTAALAHYNHVLVPNIAAGAAPLGEWIDYGQRLGELSGSGKVVRIDKSGRARPYDGIVEGLILHLPDDTSAPALALAIPREPSEAQRATLELLVKR